MYWMALSPGNNNMASILRKLSDADLDVIHNDIRRDAIGDLALAEKAEKMLGEKIAETDHAKAMVIHRYRNGAAYKKWLNDWKFARLEMETRIREMRSRYEMVTSLVQGDDGDGFEAVSKTIQARLLTLATEADDIELKMAAGAKGWVYNSLKLARAVMTDKWHQQVEDLKAQLRDLGKGGRAEGVDMADVIDKVDHVMGLK